MKLSPTEIFEGKKIFFIGGSKSLVLVGLVFSLTIQISACEPAVPLGQVALFPGAIAKSLYLLIATVVLKSVAFAFLEKSLIWWKAVLFIFIANIATTIIGFASMIPSSMFACLPLLLISYFVAYIPAKGLSAQYFLKEKQKAATNLIAIFLALMSFGSALAFIVAKGAPEIGTPYWTAKIVCIFLGLIFGIMITIFYEEWFVSKLAKRKDSETPFLTSVTRANLIALLFMMIVTALIMVPEKIQNQDYGFLR
ncbi:MAG TPA: hypothetical protein PKY59_08255 [Pyrinomonadaceae bacterium]|nr:hypothetical protein [Pyrinomonadaceae bacterium]